MIDKVIMPLPLSHVILEPIKAINVSINNNDETDSDDNKNINNNNSKNDNINNSEVTNINTHDITFNDNIT